MVHELVADKLPRLNRHLENYSIDVTLVTFNWFLTLYIDALPTEVGHSIDVTGLAKKANLYRTSSASIAIQVSCFECTYLMNGGS